MSYRIHYSLPASNEAIPLPGTQLADTAEQYPHGQAEDAGETISVNYDQPYEIVVSLTSNVGRQDHLHTLKKQAEFNLLVTESAQISEGGKRMKKDVRTTRYTRLKPTSFLRSAEAGKVTLVAKSFDVPEDDYLLGDD